MTNKKQQNISTENFSQSETDIYDHIKSLKTNESFNVIVDYFSIPPHIQNHYSYFYLFYKLKSQNSTSFISFIDSMLSEISVFLKKFEDEVLFAKFNSISKEETDIWLMSNVFKELKIKQDTFDIEKYPLTESKLLKLKNQLLEEKISILEKKINLREAIIIKLYDGLKDYFIKEEHQQLHNVLKGKSFENKICFLKNQSQLAELFRRLKYNNKLDPTYSTIRDWLCTNFTYSNSRKPLNPKSVYEILIAKGNKDISPSKRILTSDFTYKKPKQVKIDK